MPEPYFKLESAGWTAGPLTFQELQGRLLSYVVRRIRNGEFTERGLARILGVSQPQLHNVLKGARPLRPEFADYLLHHFEIGVLDLVGAAELSLQSAAYEEANAPWWPDLKKGTAVAPSRAREGSPQNWLADWREVRTCGVKGETLR
jgi:hypothetical protein